MSGFQPSRVIYFSVYVFTLIFIVLYLLTLGLITPYRSRMRVATIWPGFMGSTWLKLATGIRINVKGKENLPNQPYIAVCNHQSEWETLYLARLLCPASIVMKESLLKIPVYGWGQRQLRPIAIDRSSPKASIRAILKQGTKRLEEGNNLLIFPEGTRVEPGSVRKYTRSAFKIAVATGVPLVPIVQNSGDFWLKRRFYKGTIQMQIGEPIDPAGMTEKELTERVETWSQETYSKLNQP